MINFEKVIERIKKTKNVKSKKEVAEILNISAADLSNRLKRKTILPLIVEWGINENVNLNWLLKEELSRSDQDLDKLIRKCEEADEKVRSAILTILEHSKPKEE